MPLCFGQPFVTEVDHYTVDASVGRSFGLCHLQIEHKSGKTPSVCQAATDFKHYFVDGNVRFLPVHCSKRKTALLQLRLWIIPFLVDDELVQPREETDLGKLLTILQVLIYVEGPEEGL